MPDETLFQWGHDWPDYFGPSFFGFKKAEDSRLGRLLKIINGDKKIDDLTDYDCRILLGFEQEECKLTGREITAEIVRQHCENDEIKRRAEAAVCNLIYNLIGRCESLNDRVTELEAALKKETVSA